MMTPQEHAVPDPIESREWLEETLPVQPGGTLYVRSERGTVDVRSHDGDEVRVEAEARGRRAEQVRFVLEQSGDDVRFEARVSGWLTGLFGSLDVRVRLWVPRRYSLVLRSSGGDVRVDGITGDVSLETSGGDASLTHTVGPIDLSSSGGNLEIVHVDGDVRVKTSGGNLALRDVFGDVAARSSGGELEIDGVDGAVDLQSSGGSTSVVFLGDPEGEIKGSGGSIEVLVREDARFELDAKSSGGGIDVDFELDRVFDRSAHVLAGALGSGGPKLRLRSSGGGIRIAQL
jgi:DUF4097 and DUF4098 domain-containing protein YvlB